MSAMVRIEGMVCGLRVGMMPGCSGRWLFLGVVCRVRLRVGFRMMPGLLLVALLVLAGT